MEIRWFRIKGVDIPLRSGPNEPEPVLTESERNPKGEKGDRGEPGFGIDGRDGKDGIDGDSAYQVWLKEGNTGTEADFLESLNGKDGNDGKDGESIRGPHGKDGKDGKDATETNLGELNDVVIKDPLRGQYLIFNGIDWINTALEPQESRGYIQSPRFSRGLPGLTGATGDKGDTGDVGSINGYDEKPTPASTDILLIEDSADTYTKKKIQIGNLPGLISVPPAGYKKIINLYVDPNTGEVIFDQED